jgi:hypothetical protein
MLGGCTIFDTNVENPNAVQESALSDPASAGTQANGLGAALTRALSSIYGPYSVASDELTWVGSREHWGLLDVGDVSNPTNEYTNGAYPLMSEVRWLSDYTIARLEGFDEEQTLRNRNDLARTYIYAAIAYITIGDMYDDFVLTSDRLVAAAPIGEANMSVAYDSAIGYLDRGLVIAQATSNNDLRAQILGLRARAKFSKALWQKLRPARTTPADPLVNDAGANADATAALALMSSDYRLRLTPTSVNNAAISVGSEMNSRAEIRAGGDYVNPDPDKTSAVLAGLPGIKLRDPISGQPDPVIARAIDDCCRVSSTTLIPMTVVSAREMHLILAEAALAAGSLTEMRTRINNVRALDASLPAWDGATPPPLDMLIHERRVNLFFQGRRLHDLYRFGIDADRWLSTSVAAQKTCFFPVATIERQSNLLAPQPATARSEYCQPTTP